MTIAKSLKALAADAENPHVKKTDIFRVDPRVMSEEEGFNLRDYDDPEVQAHIRSFADSYKAGSFVPPLVVRVMDDGRIVPVEGHCRRRGALLAIAEGTDIPFLDCVNFRGNDVDRIELMLRSAEGLKLKPLDMGLGFLRLLNKGFDIAGIASTMRGKVGVQRINQLLVLAQANHDVQQLVRAGHVAADVAIEAVRDHGEGAGAFLAAQLDNAKAIGKATVTKAVVKGPSLPPKAVASFVDNVKCALTNLSPATRIQVATLMTASPEEVVGKTITVDASLMVELLRAHEAIEEEHRKVIERHEAKLLAASQETIPGSIAEGV
jgi:ParB family chromosome partitioning protein